MAHCYMCTAPATSREHAPPKCFFPEFKDVGVDLRKNLVTVPSCDAHNSHKSADDQYAMVVTVGHMDTNDVARSQFRTKCIQSLRHSAAFTQSVFGSAKPIYVDGRPTVVVNVDLDRFHRVMQHICHALVFAWMGYRMPQPFEVWSPVFRYDNLKTEPELERLSFLTRQLVKGCARWGRIRKLSGIRSSRTNRALQCACSFMKDCPSTAWPVPGVDTWLRVPP